MLILLSITAQSYIFTPPLPELGEGPGTLWVAG
jgi:hypothetical protein